MLRVILFLALCLLIAPDRSHVMRDTVITREPVATCAAPIVPGAIPTEEQFIELAKAEPIACFRAAVARYHRDVPHGYTALMRKHERINGRLNAPEKVEVSHRNEPHAVFMKWVSDPAGQADRVLYVAGANDNQIVCRPKSAIARAVAGSAVAVDPYGRDAKGGGRVAVPDSGLLKTAEHIIGAWEKAKEDGRLQVEYLGVSTIEELDGGSCHMFRRTLDTTDAEGLHQVTVGLDVETWQPVVNILTDANGKLIASYHFKNFKPVDEFPASAFEKSALSK